MPNFRRKKEKKAQDVAKTDASEPSDASTPSSSSDTKTIPHVVASGAMPTPGDSPEEERKKLIALMNKMGISAKHVKPADDHSGKRKIHKFWKTQPVPQGEEETKEEKDGEIYTMPKDMLRPKPYPLPKEFEWSVVDIQSPEALKEVYELLTLHYVEDDDAMFRFNYSADFLNWALKPPGWNPDWMVGVRVASSKKLVAFIAGVPLDLRVRDHKQRMVEINFLCIHKKLRSKRLAPVLIKEVTRRVNLTGIFQAVYTAGVVLPTPVSTCRYFHRTINYKKLLETGFTRVPSNSTVKQQTMRYHLPKEPSTVGLRPMRSEDIGQVRDLLNRYLSKCTQLSPVFETDEEFSHWLLPVEGVLWTYVVEGEEGQITAFFSYYSLPSSVIGNPKHETLSAAYLNYYALELPEDAAKVESPEHKAKLTSLIRDALILAKNEGFDVFNCLHLLRNKDFLDELQFGPGDGFLNYYLFNWRTKPIDPNEIGLVML